MIRFDILLHFILYIDKNSLFYTETIKSKTLSFRILRKMFSKKGHNQMELVKLAAKMGIDIENIYYHQRKVNGTCEPHG